ncbi:hypothetical protein [Sphingomonas sp. 22176]|uniref:hypothetical protein n=1 Tax=Sphingomonas sp. 22176 TaxID=3453884 RepID=UPI003F832612
MTDEATYARVMQLASDVPDLKVASPERARWLGRLYAAIEEADRYSTDLISLTVAADGLVGALADRSAQTIENILYRTLARLERKLPEQAQGGFIAARNVLDALATLGAVMEKATERVLIIDPYMSGVALSKYAVMIPEGVQVDLLGGERNRKPDLTPTAQAWVEQYGDRRPLRARWVSDSRLHDRLLFIDDREVWDVSQSLNKLADRSPATIAKSPAEHARLKLAAYLPLFEQGTSII